MKKYVYLFELDSVRKTDEEIREGQKALFNEIVSNGNTVVLTYNQLVDSRGFFSLLHIEDYYNNIISLFKNGALCISQYGDIRTISQYLISSFDYEKEFIYSGWPLKSTQKRLLALIKRSLMYSDLSEINDFLNGRRSEEDVLDLFVEIEPGKHTEIKTCFGIEQCREILYNLYWLLKTVLRLSSMHSIYISPREVSEYKELRFHHILRKVTRLEAPKRNKLWSGAIAVLRELPCFDSDNRSLYIHDLLEYYQRNSNVDRKICQYAEAIVNLVYNYACEISICNISKHYNIDELKDETREGDTFETDFFSRMSQYWKIGRWDERFLLEESNAFEIYKEEKDIPDFSQAVRVTNYIKEYTAKVRKQERQECPVSRYEYEFSKQRRMQKQHVITSIGKELFFSLFCIIIACIFELLWQLIQNAFDDVIIFNIPMWGIIDTLIFLFVTEAVTTLLSQMFPQLLSLGDALEGIARLFRDAAYFMFRRRESYRNKNNTHTDAQEERSKGAPIDFVRTTELKRYIIMRRNKSDNPLFRKSEIYPLAEIVPNGTEDPGVLKSIIRTEEVYNYRFGVIYKSKFNTMLVDPIDAQGEHPTPFFPYERIVPTQGNGVVIVPKYKDRLILLEQYRHAPRKKQYAFPRGYGEMGIMSIENAEKELKEEINAVVTSSPRCIGTIMPDSGLTTSEVKVYLIEIDQYESKAGHEGIIGIKECSEAEFEELLRQNEGVIDDGFTLAAYLLYRTKGVDHGI